MTHEEVDKLWSADFEIADWMSRAGELIVKGIRTDWTARDAEFATRVIAMCKKDANE